MVFRGAKKAQQQQPRQCQTRGEKNHIKVGGEVWTFFPFLATVRGMIHKTTDPSQKNNKI